MTKPLLALALALALALVAGVAPAQTPTPDAVRGTAFTLNVAKLDVLIQVVPLALTKEQITPLLTAIEKVRQRQKELFAQEAKDLAEYEPLVAKAVADGIDKGVYPPRELQRKIAAFNRLVGTRRGLFYVEMTDDVFKVCKNVLNEGQLKAMEKSLKPELLEPGAKSADMDSDAKVKFFVRKVILDPNAYDVLVAMSRRKEDPAPTTTP